MLIKNYYRKKQKNKMRINGISSVNFGILDPKSVSKRSYGTYYKGSYKNYTIEVFDARKFKEKLIYVSDKVGNFIKYKLTYFQDNLKKVTKSQRAF